MTNSRIAFQIRFRHFRHNRNTKSDSGRWSYRPVNCICTKKYTVHRGSCRFSAGVEASVTWHTGFSQWRPLFVDSRRQIAQSQNRRRMCEIRLTKLSCAAQQEGIVHFYAVTDIKGLSCPLWWMREWRNLLTSTHVGYRSVIRAVASGVSLKFGVQGASATNWLSRVNGARDSTVQSGNAQFGSNSTIFRGGDLGIWRMTLKNNRAPLLCYFKLCASFRSHLVNSNFNYSPETPNLGQIRRFLEACDLEIWQMTLQNNRAPLLCYFKLSTSFRSHWWIQTWVTVRKRTPNLGQIRRFLEACDLEIWQMTLQNNRAPLLCYFKLSTSFRSHWWIQTWVTVRKRPIWVKFDDF